MSIANALARARYQFVPDRQIGELLAKPWVDTAIPTLLLLLVIGGFGVLVPGFFSVGNLSDTSRQWGEIGFLALGLMVVILSGGIDLSVGAVYGLASFATIAALQGLHLPVAAGLGIALIVGGTIGLINGLLVGVLKMRAFLSTLALLIICRSIQETLALRYGASLLNDPGNLDLWYWFGDGSVLGFPISLVLLILAGLATHFLLTRMSLGWRIQAVGGSRRSAYNAGIGVSSTIVFCYVFSGFCAGMAGFLFSARTANPGAEVGVGFEIVALTAAILGGNSLGGGRGSASKAILGALIIIVIINSLVALSLPSGTTGFALGLTLLVAVLIDIRWMKHRSRIIDRGYVSPAYHEIQPMSRLQLERFGKSATDSRLADAEPLALGKLGGPRHLVFDSNDYLYTVNGAGDIVRLAPPSYSEAEIFVHIGGQPLGLAMDAKNNIYACVAGIGLFLVSADRVVKKLSDHVPRTLLSIRDDSQIKFAYDLDVAPDGRIYFSDASGRFDVHDWVADSLEMRANGRLLVFDPATGKTATVLRDLIFPSGVSIEEGGLSLLFAEAWACRVSRFWLAGPRKGQVEPVIENLPGFPGGIGRASDGNHWLAILGVRTPCHELTMELPGFRKRMAQRVAYDEWLYPNFNAGIVLKFTGKGEVVDCLWDKEGKQQAALSVAREHRGNLYLGGVFNNRIGRVALAAADPDRMTGRTDGKQP